MCPAPPTHLVLPSLCPSRSSVFFSCLLAYLPSVSLPFGDVCSLFPNTSASRHQKKGERHDLDHWMKSVDLLQCLTVAVSSPFHDMWSCWDWERVMWIRAQVGVGGQAPWPGAQQAWLSDPHLVIARPACDSSSFRKQRWWAVAKE